MWICGVKKIRLAADCVQHSLFEWVAQDDGLLAVRARRHHVYRYADQFFDALDVGARRRWQGCQRFRADRAFGPAWHLFVHWHATGGFFSARWEDVHGHAVDGVAGAQLQRFDTIQYVQLGQAHAGHAVDLYRAAQQGSVEPAAAAGTARHGAEFMADLRQVVTDAGIGRQFRREWAGANARRVSLGDAHDVVQHARAYARTGGGIAGHAVRRSDEWVGTVVDVEQGTLRAFEQQVGASLVGFVQRARYVSDHRTQTRHVGQRVIQGFLVIDAWCLQVVLQHEVMVIQVFGQFFSETGFVEQVGNADGATRHLVFVGWADALARGADLGCAARSFTGQVERRVVRQDHRCGVRHFQARSDFDANGFELVDFAQYVRYRNDHAVTDVAGDAWTHDARRDQLQCGFHAADDQRVACIVAALEAHHTLGVIGQPIDELAFTFIAPLGADDNDVLCHNFL